MVIMQILEGSQVTMFDVDDTIIMWAWPQDDETDTWIELEPWGLANGKVKLCVNQEMVEQIKKHNLRGHKVVVWSQGGWDWALTVVKALKLEKYVSLVMEKPVWIYDDLQPTNFMPRAQWVGRKEWLEEKQNGNKS